MSYCRWMSGDLYMFWNVSGTIECMACPMKSNEGMWESASFDTFTDAIKHLQEHERNGDDFPSYAVDGLMDDLQKYGDNVVEASKKLDEEIAKKSGEKK